MTTHRHHSTPVSLGGIGPIQLVEDREHSYIHFHRFLNGEDKMFHGGLLRFLDPWDQMTVRKKMSEVHSGKGNPMYGTTSPTKGWKWWNDGEDQLLSPDPPGPTWREGVLPETKKNLDHFGEQFWNDGETQTLSFECPEGFVKGRLSYPKPDQKQPRYWTNGTDYVRSYECPGDGWVVGGKPHGKTKQTFWRCLVTGHVSNTGGLTKFQKSRGINPTLREKVVG